MNPASLSTLSPDFWSELFGNSNPTAIEIGPGRGEFLVAVARLNPQQNFFAIERATTSARWIERKLHDHPLPNVQILCSDAQYVLQILPDSCVATFHIQFPDPWWKRRHVQRRLLTLPFVRQLARTLVRGGTVELITDVPDYFSMSQSLLDTVAELECLSRGPVTNKVTSFARKALQRGNLVQASTHRRV